MIKFLSGTVLILASTPVSGEVCSTGSFNLKNSANLADLITKAKSLNLTKDEYETTAVFNQRAAGAASSMPQAYVTFVIPQEFLAEYDADTQTMKLSAYSLPTICSSFESATEKLARGLPFGKYPEGSSGMELGATFCAEYVTSRADGKPYTAKNGYGATVNVTPIVENAAGLYFGYGALGQTLIDGRESYSDKPTFQFSATPEEAKSFKANSALVFLAKPATPYLIEGSHYSSATVAHPYEVARKSAYLAVSATCIAVADRVTGKVFDAHGMPIRK